MLVSQSASASLGRVGSAAGFSFGGNPHDTSGDGSINCAIGGQPITQARMDDLLRLEHIFIELDAPSNSAEPEHPLMSVEEGMLLRRLKVLVAIKEDVFKNWSIIDAARSKFDQLMALQKALDSGTADAKVIADRDNARKAFCYDIISHCTAHKVVEREESFEELESESRSRTGDLLVRRQTYNATTNALHGTVPNLENFDVALAKKVKFVLLAELHHRDVVYATRRDCHRTLVEQKKAFAESVNNLQANGTPIGSTLRNEILPKLAAAVAEWNTPYSTVKDSIALRTLRDDTNNSIEDARAVIEEQRIAFEELIRQQGTQRHACEHRDECMALSTSLLALRMELRKLRKREKKAKHHLEGLEMNSDDSDADGAHEERLVAARKQLAGVQAEIASALDWIRRWQSEIVTWKTLDRFPELAFDIEPSQFGPEWSKFAVPRKRSDYVELEAKPPRVFFARRDNIDVVLKRYGVCEPSLPRTVANELKVRNRVRHPNVLSPTVGFVDGKYLYLEFPRMQGTLKDVRLEDLHSWLYFFSRAWSALEALHAHKIVSGDIKPENILYSVKLDDEGRMLPPEPMLCDFSEAHVGGTTRVVSFDFIPPERSNELLPQHDVYQLGKCMERVRIPEDQPSVISNVKELIAKCTHSDPQRRYSVESVRNQFAHMLFMSRMDMKQSGANALAVQNQLRKTEGQLQRFRALQPPEYWSTWDTAARLQVRCDVAKQHIVADLTRHGFHIFVREVYRNENGHLWLTYRTECLRLQGVQQSRAFSALSLQSAFEAGTRPYALFPDPIDDLAVHEHHLYHGTTVEVAKQILEHGFDPSRSGERAGARFGQGCYFARDPRKAMQYAKGALLVVRVVLGHPALVNPGNYRRPPPMPGATNHECDSVIGKSDYYEYVVFRHSKAYPEYFVPLG